MANDGLCVLREVVVGAAVLEGQSKVEENGAKCWVHKVKLLVLEAW